MKKNSYIGGSKRNMFFPIFTYCTFRYLFAPEEVLGSNVIHVIPSQISNFPTSNFKKTELANTDKWVQNWCLLSRELTSSRKQDICAVRSTLNRARLLQDSSLVYDVNTTLHHFNPTVYFRYIENCLQQTRFWGKNSISEMHSNCAHILIVL